MRYKNQKHPLKSTWTGINQRCNNSKCSSYLNYGGRGIKNEWISFNDFCNDMYESYKDHCKKYSGDVSIDRINVNGNYSKENCRWATNSMQARNTRNTIRAIYNNEEVLLIDVSNKFKIPQISLVKEYRKTGNLEESINVCLEKNKILGGGYLYEHNNELRTLLSWSKELNISYLTILQYPIVDNIIKIDNIELIRI